MESKRPPQRVRVFVGRHKTTGLWKAESPDVRGFLIFDHSEEALIEDAQEAIETLLKEEGYDIGAGYQPIEDQNDWVMKAAGAELCLATDEA